MPQIPTPTTQVAARTGRTSGPFLDQNVSPDVFGAGVGRAMREVGGAITNVGIAAQEKYEQQRKERVANAVAQSDFTPYEVEARGKVGPDGAGYRDSVLAKYDEFVETEANKIDDDIARMEYRRIMAAQKPEHSSRAALYEEAQQTNHSKAQADASLMSLENRIVNDPTLYETYVKQGADVIATRPGLTQAQIQAMQTQWRQNSARGRFTGMLENATSVQDIDNIAAELAQLGDGKIDWTKEFAADDYVRMVDTIGNTRKAFVTAADASARAAIETLDARNADLKPIPPEELRAVAGLVRSSQNPVTQAKFARIQRDQELMRNYSGATPAQLRAEINGASGNPGAAYPGVPPVVSQAINTATSQFGVSAAYLGATATQEYGQFFGKGPARGKPQFAPVPVHGGVDLRNVKPEVVDAAAVAGELFGAPLQITSGARSQEKQDAIRAQGDPNRVTVASHSKHTEGEGFDISTVGMSEADQGRLAAALVDAGFTGIGQYDTHMHADMRDGVPKTFGDQGGKTWGGWTYLSPSVAKALIDRGFTGGKPSADIARASTVAPQAQIDFGVQAATSTATGVMQFTEGTFLDLMSDGVTAQRMGIDTTGMSRQQIIDLRKDPQVSILAGAALGEKNKVALENALGRTVSDPELYMAHFLGVGGAMSLLTALNNDPNASAADLLPQAAGANKAVFYNGKTEEPKTVQEVYNSIARKFVTAPSQVAYGDNVMRDRLLTATEKGLKDDPMTFVQQQGKFDVQPLTDEASFASRGAAARTAAEYYTIPISEFKPLTNDEAATLSAKMDSGSADDVLEVMANVQQMGGDVARAAFKQLGQKDQVYAYAAGLAYEANNPVAAGDVVRGRKRLEENTALGPSIGSNEEVSQVFASITQGSLFDIAPQQRQAIQDAALAHYAETYTARGGVGLDAAAFERSVQAVLGGGSGAPALANVNGAPTVLPPGLDAETLNTALDRMTVADWTRLSPQKKPPRYADGRLAEPDEIANEAKLRTVGGGQYKLMFDDGTFAITGEVLAGGRYEVYLFAPDAKALGEIAVRPVPGLDVPTEPQAPGSNAPVGFVPGVPLVTGQ